MTKREQAQVREALHLIEPWQLKVDYLAGADLQKACDLLLKALVPVQQRLTPQD